MMNGDSDATVKFFSIASNGSRRVFTLRKSEISLKKLALFSTIAPESIEVRAPGGSAVALEDLQPHLEEPYEVVRIERTVQTEWIRVCTEEEFESRKSRIGAVRLGILGRDVMILKTRNGYRVFDSVCFHAGGPLSDGSIEELPSGECIIVCPWHRYRINTTTGVALTSGIKAQRVHRCKVEDGAIFVFLDEEKGDVPSDFYAKMGLYAGT